MVIYSIYKITNLTNDKIYIGWTSRDPLLRFEEHQKTHKPKYQDRSAISYAIEKHGVENFAFEVIYQSHDYDHSRQIETHFIQECNCLAEQWGYNLDLGGTGHKRTTATIEKHRAAIKGRKQSAEHVAKRARYGKDNPMYGKTGELHHRYGKNNSDHQKQKSREANAKSYIITFPDGTEQCITNLRQFARDNNLDHGNLCSVAGGRMKQHKGFKVRHA